MRTKSRSGAATPADGPRESLRDGDFSAPPSPSPRPLDRVLRELFPTASWNELRRLVHRGKVRIEGTLVTDATVPVDAGARIALRLAAPRPLSTSSVLAPDAIVYADADVVVANKPPGIATVPYENERDTLDRLLGSLLRRRESKSGAPLGVVQRLDKETSGLIVFARTLGAKRALQQQLRVHSVHRRYLALAHGSVEAATFKSRLVTDRGDGRRGSTNNPTLGREAITHVRPVEGFAAATLVECRLQTGRTHQIRIHLAEAGHPLLGERVYAPPAARLLSAPRVLLHAAELGFDHPRTGKPLRFSLPLPGDFEHVLDELRRDSPARPSPRAPRTR